MIRKIMSHTSTTNNNSHNTKYFGKIHPNKQLVHSSASGSDDEHNNLEMQTMRMSNKNHGSGLDSDYKPNVNLNDLYEVSLKTNQWLKTITVMLMLILIVNFGVLIVWIYIGAIAREAQTTVTTTIAKFDMDQLATNTSVMANNFAFMSVDPLTYAVGAETKGHINTLLEGMALVSGTTQNEFNITQFPTILHNGILYINQTIHTLKVKTPEAVEGFNAFMATLHRIAALFAAPAANP